MQDRSIAEQLDLAVGMLVAGSTPPLAAAAAGIGRDGRPLVDLAARLRASLGPAPVGPRFDARVGARLAGAAAGWSPMAWARRHPGRLIVTGAVGSAVGVGVTAFAVWRTSRRGAAHRLLPR